MGPAAIDMASTVRRLADHIDDAVVPTLLALAEHLETMRGLRVADADASARGQIQAEGVRRYAGAIEALSKLSALCLASDLGAYALQAARHRDCVAYGLWQPERLRLRAEGWKATAIALATEAGAP
jgi:hypothetical protein